MGFPRDFPRAQPNGNLEEIPFLYKPHTRFAHRLDLFHFVVFFLELKTHAKFQNSRTTPSGRKITQAERRK